MSGRSRPGETLIRVAWLPTERRWNVAARPSTDQEWVSHEGDESELDELLSIARDVVTGG